MTPIGKKGQEVDVLMSAKPDSGRNEATIARVGKRKFGYNTVQVDEFLDKAHALYESEDPSLTQDQIANASFELCKGGYTIAQVDAALARLERAISDRSVAREINQSGMEAWSARVVRQYRALKRHANRDGGDIFDRGLSGKPTYDCKQVDRLVFQVLDRIADDLHLRDARRADGKKSVDITSDRISNVIFTQRKGKHGYDERQVDYFLSKAVELLQQMESVARLGLDAQVHDGTRPNAGSGSNRSKESPSVGTAGEDRSIKPLIGQQQVPAWQAGQPTGSAGVARQGFAEASAAQPAEAGSTDFAQLHQAEQAIFDSPQPTAPAVSASGAIASSTPEVPTASQMSGSLGALARSVGQNRDQAGTGTGTGGAQASQPAPFVSSSQPVRSADSAQSSPSVSSSPVQPPQADHVPSSQPVQSASGSQPSSAPASGHDWSTQPAFTTPSSRSGAGSSFNSPVGVSGPLSAQPEPQIPSAWSRPQEESVQPGAAPAVSDEPSWTRPVSADSISKAPVRQAAQDADSYLNSLVNTDLPKMDMDFDIPDISFPAFEADGQKDEETKGTQA